MVGVEKKGCLATGIQAVGFPRFQQGKGSDGCMSGCAEPRNADWELDDGVTVCVLKIMAHPPTASLEILVLRCSGCMGGRGGGQGWGFLFGARELISSSRGQDRMWRLRIQLGPYQPPFPDHMWF